MLLEFKTKNYKSFSEEMTFSLTPAPKQKGLDYSVMSALVGRKSYNGLCSAVIYGPNASGKTNLIGAMDTFKEIVLRGNIRNEDTSSLNLAASSLELIPNCNGNNSPTEFSIRFIEDGLLIQYSLVIDLGTFLDKDYKRTILEEKLTVNERLVFQRAEHLIVNLPSVIKEYTNKSIKKKTLKKMILLILKKMNLYVIYYFYKSHINYPLPFSNAFIIGNTWAIPDNAEKPKDARIKTGKYIKSKITIEDN